jgi:hypothetical protein
LPFKRFKVRQSRHYEPLLVRLTGGDETENVFGERLARLRQLWMNP